MGVRPPMALLVALVALLALVGCGGNQITADEVASDPPVLRLPPGESPGALTADRDTAADEEDEEDEDTDSAPTADPATGTVPATPPAQTAPAPTATAAPAQPPAEQQPPADTGGADADAGLDQFCADNPGAC